MGLYANGYRLGNTPFKRGLGALVSIYNGGGTNFNHKQPTSSLRTSSGLFGEYSGLPSGGLYPGSWMLPQKPGVIAARGTVIGSGAVSPSAQAGKNIDATITGAGGVSIADLGLIVTLAATIIAMGGISSAAANALATMVAEIAGSGDLEATAQGLAELGATLTGSGAVTANNTALMDIAATIRGYGDLTPEGIRDTVWQAILANYPDAGTAGNALGLASSGGVDYDTLAAAVLAAAQASPIHANAKEINDEPLIGDGRTTEFHT